MVAVTPAPPPVVVPVSGAQAPETSFITAAELDAQWADALAAFEAELEA